MNEPITKLPDGSAFFTATVMSKEEALALPLRERPICFRISSEMYHAVFEAIGAASMCWNPRPSDEVFASEQASDVAVKLCFKIAEEVEGLVSVRDALIEEQKTGAYFQAWEKVKKERDEWCAEYVKARDALRKIYAIAENYPPNENSNWLAEQIEEIALKALGRDGVNGESK